MLSIIGLIFNIIGTGIMAKGVLTDDEVIRRVSETRWNGNPDLRDKLLKDRRDAKRGLFFLVVGFIFQFVNEILLSV